MNGVRIARVAPGEIALIGAKPFHNFRRRLGLRENRNAKTGGGAPRSAVSYERRLFMEHIEKSVDVDAPLSVVYNQWTQFEEFPEFMEGVLEVRQLDDKRLHWRAKIAGKEKEWDAEIFEQSPDERIAWRSMSGAMNS